MRTRNSWRNQDILFRALFKPADPPPAPRREPVPTVDSIQARLAEPFLSRRERMRLTRELAHARAVAAVRARLALEP